MPGGLVRGNVVPVLWQASANGASLTTIGIGPVLFIAQVQESQQLRLLTTYTDGQGIAETVITSAGTVPLPPALPPHRIKPTMQKKITILQLIPLRVTSTGD
jgi:hypothetical protein